MASLNKVMLIGNAGRDAEMRYTANGTAQTSFSLAVNRNYRDPGGSGEWREETEWFNIVAWRDLAERISQQVTKGKQVYVEGRLQTRSWDNAEGVKQYRTEVIAERIFMLGSRDREGGGGGADWGDGGYSAPRGGQQQSRSGYGAPRTPAGAGSGGNFEDPDDLPFE